MSEESIEWALRVISWLIWITLIVLLIRLYRKRAKNKGKKEEVKFS